MTSRNLKAVRVTLLGYGLLMLIMLVVTFFFKDQMSLFYLLQVIGIAFAVAVLWIAEHRQRKHAPTRTLPDSKAPAPNPPED